MFPKDFAALGIHCGIKKENKKKDLALFYSEYPCKASVLSTSNIVKAAPVLLNNKAVKENKNAFRAVIVNSGCANACTGKHGMQDAMEMCKLVADGLKLKQKEVLVASTGVIGAFLPMKKVKKGIETITDRIQKSHNEISAVQAIMTTDTKRKISSRKVSIGGKNVVIWGCAKGSGMIHPDLIPHATMISAVLTDANISKECLKDVFSRAVNNSFNCVTVDGDTSTNDTAIILANGRAGNKVIKAKNNSFNKFGKALNEVCVELAKMIARDGEGATKLVEVEVRGCKSPGSAKKVASVIATSPLVKTAIFGCDANWGRILAACGRSDVDFNPEKIAIYIGNKLIFHKGMPAKYSESKLKGILKKKNVKITVDLNQGDHSAKYFTCDFSFDYIKINASYRS
ncbi:MAG: bifunctional glutamate N-acetyltransferase/amino-acid acetyltransferase ArgJ [Endomicrobiales bacterium]|nr:bifunctional glutamate N-acetyltransferase/amino-acid acetyltransferase ArgJ [Endomicrobiales bacterium]